MHPQVDSNNFIIVELTTRSNHENQKLQEHSNLKQEVGQVTGLGIKCFAAIKALTTTKTTIQALVLAGKINAIPISGIMVPLAPIGTFFATGIATAGALYGAGRLVQYVTRS